VPFVIGILLQTISEFESVTVNGVAIVDIINIMMEITLSGKLVG
jgi:hypothetical protein